VNRPFTRGWWEKIGLQSAHGGMKTWVKSIAKALEKLDSGFCRNDANKKQIDFFHTFPFPKGKKEESSTVSHPKLPSL